MSMYILGNFPFNHRRVLTLITADYHHDNWHTWTQTDDTPGQFRGGEDALSWAWQSGDNGSISGADSLLVGPCFRSPRAGGLAEDDGVSVRGLVNLQEARLLREC